MLWDGFATAQKQKTLVGSSSSVASDTHTAHHSTSSHLESSGDVITKPQIPELQCERH